MRSLTLLLALLFAVGASLPCAGGRLGAVDFSSQHGKLHGHAENSDELPCHAHAVPSTLKAPCPCGCDDHAPGATSLGSLGVAVLQRAEPMPSAGRAALLAEAPHRTPRAPLRGIEKVPRAG